MIEPIMYIGIGFLVAGLLVIGAIPMVHARAVRQPSPGAHLLRLPNGRRPRRCRSKRRCDRRHITSIDRSGYPISRDPLDRACRVWLSAAVARPR